MYGCTVVDYEKERLAILFYNILAANVETCMHVFIHLNKIIN